MSRSSRRASAKPLLFISHYSQEKAVALALQATLEDALLDRFEVFVSSDEVSITLGADFDAAIHDALSRACYGLCLFTPEGLKRPWINIEFGALWYAKKPVVPVCFGGQEVGKLPAPYGNKNGLDATHEPSLNKLVANIAHTDGMRAPVVDWTPFLDVVRAFNHKAAHPWPGSDEERQVFTALYDDAYEPDEREAFRPGWAEVTAAQLASRLGLSEEQVMNAAEALNERGLLEVALGHGGALTGLDWTPAGWEQYIWTKRADWSAVRAKVATALVGQREPLDAAALAAQLDLGYWPVVLVLLELHSKQLVGLTETSFGVGISFCSSRIERDFLSA